jgi:hypothetical protein
MATDEILPNTISYPDEPTPEALRRHLAGLTDREKFDSILLHYGPYAYAKDGKPAAFTGVIEEFASGNRMLIFFHELSSTGLPWQRAFWTSREQKASLRRLFQATSIAFVSNPCYLQMSQPFNAAGREIIEIPIFSNAGEPENLRSLDQRRRQLVVFGQLATRERLFKARKKILTEVCRKLGIKKIVEAGSGSSPLIPKEIAGIPVVSAGWLSEDQISELLADSIAGIIGYWPIVWQKSGVIAAYQAHAMLPILVAADRRKVPASAYLPYVTPEELARFPERGSVSLDSALQAFADASRAYYLRYQSVKHAAEVIAGLAFPG